MSASVPRFSFCVFVMACLAGCGGSSGGGSTGGGGGSSTTVTYTFTGATPTAVATKVGSGEYTQATLASGKLSISLPSGTANYSIAWVCPPPPMSSPPAIDESVIEASVQDGTSFSLYCPDSNATTGTATVQVDASAIAGGELIAVQGGIEDDTGGPFQLWQSGTVNLSGQMAAGTYDVFVYVEDVAGDLLAVKILPNQTIPGALNGGNTLVFEASDLTAPQTLTINNIPSGFSVSSTSVHYQTPTPGDGLGLGSGLGALTEYTALPSAALQSGDYYWFFTGASSSTIPNVSEYVGVEADSSTGGPETINLPAPWSYAGPTPAALPTFNYSYAGFSGMTDIEQVAFIYWAQGTASAEQIQVTATANYQNGATSITIPDLSGLTGFIAPAPSSTGVGWIASVNQGFALLASPTNGTLSTVENSWYYTEP